MKLNFFFFFYLGRGGGGAVGLQRSFYLSSIVTLTLCYTKSDSFISSLFKKLQQET